MSLTTTVSQGHHAPKTSASGRPSALQIGLKVAIRRKASWQPPQAYNNRFILEASRPAIELAGPARTSVRTPTRSSCASIPGPPGTTRGTKS